MSAMHVQFNPIPAEDTAAAILAAIACYLEPTSPADSTAASAGSAWRAAGMYEAQGLRPSRAAEPPKWSTAERNQRAARWSAGIVGM